MPRGEGLNLSLPAFTFNELRIGHEPDALALVSHDIRTYVISQATGALTQVGTVATGGINFDVRFERSVRGGR
jgi:hypothetical protein